MSIDAKATELFSNLVRETAAGKVTWKRMEPPVTLTRGTDKIFPFFFGADYKGEKIGLYETRFQDVDSDEYGVRLAWETRIGFCIYEGGPRGLVVWSYERPSPALAKLFETVRTETFKVEERLEALLK
jgi:hypothetical protein